MEGEWEVVDYHLNVRRSNHHGLPAPTGPAEMMIFANAEVAQRIATAFPGCALLRNHPPPSDQAFDQVWMDCQYLALKQTVWGRSDGLMSVAAGPVMGMGERTHHASLVSWLDLPGAPSPTPPRSVQCSKWPGRVRPKSGARGPTLTEAAPSGDSTRPPTRPWPQRWRLPAAGPVTRRPLRCDKE